MTRIDTSSATLVDDTGRREYLPGDQPDSGRQGCFDELEPPLSAVTFVVVDLETTGTDPSHSEITEIAAVRVRGGTVEAELSTFVAIDGILPPKISRLTGIFPNDLYDAPPLGEVMASFLEFSRGAVLVAHNSRFDLAFLRAAAVKTGHTWPAARTLCTLALARRILHQGETRGHKLSELAAYLGAGTAPTHRALADARATVDVLHALISRVGDCGVSTLTDLQTYDNRLRPEVRRRASLTEKLHHGPGVYIFRDEAGHALYVGSSVNVQRRARSYFSGGDTRSRMRTMVGLCTSVESVPCAHMLEAWTTEDQLIDRLQPPYNRRSKSPRRGWWLAAPPQSGKSPRVQREPVDYSLGPFRRTADARALWHTVLEVIPDSQKSNIAWWEALLNGSDSTPLRQLIGQINELSHDGSFERALRLRDRTALLIRILSNQQRAASTARCPEIVLAQRDHAGAWGVSVVRYGRLAAAGTIPPGASPIPVIDALRAGASTVEPGNGPLYGATMTQIAAVHKWIDMAPTRIVEVQADGAAWTLGTDGATGLLDWAQRAEDAARGPH